MIRSVLYPRESLNQQLLWACLYFKKKLTHNPTPINKSKVHLTDRLIQMNRLKSFDSRGKFIYLHASLLPAPLTIRAGRLERKTEREDGGWRGEQSHTYSALFPPTKTITVGSVTLAPCTRPVGATTSYSSSRAPSLHPAPSLAFGEEVVAPLTVIVAHKSWADCGPLLPVHQQQQPNKR